MVLNVCLIGAGRAGQFHAISINNTPNLRLTHIVDLNLEKAKQLVETIDNGDSGPPMAHDNLERVLEADLRCGLVNSEINFVIVASSTQTHYDMTMLAFRYNKHVLCEKPLGNVDQIKECYQIAESKKLHLMVGFQKRFDKNYLNFIKSLDMYDMGSLNQLTFITRDFPVPSIEYLKTSNGIINDMLSHDIDLTNVAMKGEKPISVFAFGHTNNSELKEANEIEHVNVLMNYASGTIVTLVGSRTSTHYDQRAEAYTDLLYTKMDNLKVDTTFSTENGVIMESPIENTFLQRYKDAYQNELKYFMDIIKGKVENPITCKDMLLNAEICNAINVSLKTGEKVTL
jgi:myo-inositol 2-dehydrogenase / D-chiro-inositol 1-dehydrogenase